MLRNQERMRDGKKQRERERERERKRERRDDIDGSDRSERERAPQA